MSDSGATDKQRGREWWWPRCDTCGRWIAAEAWPLWDGPCRCDDCLKVRRV